MKRLLSTFFLTLSLNMMLHTVSAQEDVPSIALAEQQKKSQTIAPFEAIAKAQQRRMNEKMASPQFNAFKAFAMHQKNPLQEQEVLSHQSVSDAIIFVSFSMPKKSVEEWLVASKSIHAPLVLRGMVDNSIKKTEQAILPLLQNVQGGFQINPLLFRSFGIEKVPAIVVINHHGCHTDVECGDKKHFDVIYGQTTLPYALSQLANSGLEAPEVATALLKTLGENHA